MSDKTVHIRLPQDWQYPVTIDAVLVGAGDVISAGQPLYEVSNRRKERFLVKSHADGVLVDGPVPVGATFDRAFPVATLRIATKVTEATEETSPRPKPSPDKPRAERRIVENTPDTAIRNSNGRSTREDAKTSERHGPAGLAWLASLALIAAVGIGTAILRLYFGNWTGIWVGLAGAVVITILLAAILYSLVGDHDGPVLSVFWIGLIVGLLAAVLPEPMVKRWVAAGAEQVGAQHIAADLTRGNVPRQTASQSVSPATKTSSGAQTDGNSGAANLTLESRAATPTETPKQTEVGSVLYVGMIIPNGVAPPVLGEAGRLNAGLDQRVNGETVYVSELFTSRNHAKCFQIAEFYRVMAFKRSSAGDQKTVWSDGELQDLRDQMHSGIILETDLERAIAAFENQLKPLIVWPVFDRLADAQLAYPQGPCRRTDDVTVTYPSPQRAAR